MFNTVMKRHLRESLGTLSEFTQVKHVQCCLAHGDFPVIAGSSPVSNTEHIHRKAAVGWHPGPQSTAKALLSHRALHRNALEVLLDSDPESAGPGQGPRVCISNRLPGEAGTTWCTAGGE